MASHIQTTRDRHKKTMKKINRSIQPKRSYSTIIVLLIIAAIALFLLKNSIFDNKKNIGDGNAGSPSTTQTPNDTPPPNIDTTLTTSSTIEALSPPPSPPESEIQTPSTSCKKVSDDLHLFFKKLDGQEYIKAYTQNKPVQSYLEGIITKILNNPPVNEKETADILTVLKNAAHFFRLLGAKDLSLLKDILTNEQPTIEQQLALFYAWTTMGNECHNSSKIKIQLPLAKSYEYAAFFLNTLGGQSYLSRRDSTLRVLTRYYCVLILNQASQQSINKYNISLPYHLKAVVQDITNSDFLENQTLYLDTLQKIEVKR